MCFSCFIQYYSSKKCVYVRLDIQKIKRFLPFLERETDSKLGTWFDPASSQCTDLDHSIKKEALYLMDK